MFEYPQRRMAQQPKARERNAGTKEDRLLLRVLDPARTPPIAIQSTGNQGAHQTFGKIAYPKLLPQQVGAITHYSGLSNIVHALNKIRR
jgi:hypothetical protein